MSTIIDTLKEGMQVYGTDILASEIAKNAPCALTKDADSIAEADKAINGIYQFCTDCGYMLNIYRDVFIADDDTIPSTLLFKIVDSDDGKSYGFSLIVAIFKNDFAGRNYKIKFRDMYDHIVETSSNSRGWKSNSRKHPMTFLATKFGATKHSGSEFVWTVDNFLKVVPDLTKYFKKSNTLGKYKATNEEIIRGAQKSIRKLEIQKTKINSFVDEMENFVESIDPNLHVFVKETSCGDSKSAIFEVSIYNNRLALWGARYYWNSQKSGRSMLEEIFSEENVYSDSIPYCVNMKHIDEMKEKIKGWLDECNDTAAAKEYTKILEDEYKKPLGKIDNIYSANKEYISDFTYNGEYSNLQRSSTVSISFRLNYSTIDDNWQIRYNNVSLFPTPFRDFINNIVRVSKNPADLINYVKLVYNTSKKANDYANMVIDLTRKATADLKA